MLYVKKLNHKALVFSGLAPKRILTDFSALKNGSPKIRTLQDHLGGSLINLRWGTSTRTPSCSQFLCWPLPSGWLCHTSLHVKPNSGFQ